ncbi:MAG: sigma-70 family RNA polymerase sigma factor [Deltaproteobacteria bacterium]|nr:sigma-70 family RNA polymerase sigma factor [Deltaproteobacteria bacterium]MCB9787165.1 sigma-70 family RNA polymerase sigma factor [Deltaproteobacteria bacterium]
MIRAAPPGVNSRAASPVPRRCPVDDPPPLCWDGGRAGGGSGRSRDSATARHAPVNNDPRAASRRPWLETHILGHEDDRQLVERIVAGDHKAFRVLVERYQRRVYAVAFGIMRNPDTAMDVTQDAFVKVYKHLPNFKGDSAFYTWMYRIVVNLCIDKKRRAKKAAEVDYDDTLSHGSDRFTDGPTLASIHIDSPHRALQRQELREHMGEALEQLSDAHREILILREVDGLSYEELSEVLDIPKGTVMSRLFHARKNFQAALQGYLSS